MGRSSLLEIASIQVGYSFRKGVRHDDAGSVRVIQMRDLGNDLIVDLQHLACVDIDPPPHQWVRKGDILVRSRGDSTASAIVDKDPGHVVAAAPLLRVRTVQEHIIPAYLNWFLNQPPAQAYLARNAEGSRVKMINKHALEELEIQIPSIERQEAIVTLARLARRERALQADISRRRNRLLSEVMMSHVEGSTR